MKPPEVAAGRLRARRRQVWTGARLLGLSAAALGFAVDRLHKGWMLGPFEIEQRGRVAVAPFLDLVMVWNRGVSYGLLSQDGIFGRLILVAIAFAGSGVFCWLMLRAGRPLPAMSFGLIVGGAISNGIDRVVYGAVADFFLLHAGWFEWYVFNLADVWIVAGVGGLLIDWAFPRPEKATVR